jgi:hypothetical protein
MPSRALPEDAAGGFVGVALFVGAGAVAAARGLRVFGFALRVAGDVVARGGVVGVAVGESSAASRCAAAWGLLGATAEAVLSLSSIAATDAARAAETTIANVRRGPSRIPDSFGG